MWRGAERRHADAGWRRRIKRGSIRVRSAGGSVYAIRPRGSYRPGRPDGSALIAVVRGGSRLVSPAFTPDAWNSGSASAAIDSADA